MGVTYDAGALIAAERGERRMWARHKALLLRREVPVAPAPVAALLEAVVAAGAGARAAGHRGPLGGGVPGGGADPHGRGDLHHRKGAGYAGRCRSYPGP